MPYVADFVNRALNFVLFWLLLVGVFVMLYGAVLLVGNQFHWLLAALFLLGIPFAIRTRKCVEGAQPKTTTPAPPEPEAEPKLQPAPTGATRKKEDIMYAHISHTSIFNRLVVMLLSACACGLVGYYIYLDIWVGTLPNLGLQVPWQGKTMPIQPVMYPLLLLAVWLHFERAAAHANPGYGWLWGFDFFPSALLLGFMVLTGIKLLVAEIKFADPTQLWIYVGFAGSSLGVAYYNFRHWFKEAARAPEDQVATTEMITDALRQVMGTHSITLYPRPGYDIYPERAYAARPGTPKLEAVGESPVRSA